MKMKNQNLRISEMFHSIQGEGRNSGTPAVFLRTQNCNLLCQWCDTIEVWKKGEVYSLDQLITLWCENGWLSALQSKKSHLVITGGEPLLQQGALTDFLKILGKNVFVEVETNGTILPTEDFDAQVDQYNVSPKLANSGMHRKRRYLPEVIAWFSKKKNSYFKFVVVDEKDLREVLDDFVNPFSILPSRVYLMPASTSRAELERRSPLIITLCKDSGFNYSPRLQLSLWDRTTGV